MTSSHVEPDSMSGQNMKRPKPGWWERKLQSVADWWPVLFTGAAATAIASFLYVSSTLLFIAGRLDYGLGFVLAGMTFNAIPPAIVWAVMKWVK